MNRYMSAKIQKLSLINEPWPHAVCDDFLPEDIFGSVYQVDYDNVITSNKIEGNETTPIIRIGEDVMDIPIGISYSKLPGWTETIQFHILR